MQISWKCLNQLIDLTHKSPGEITNKLTLAGFEVENIIYKNDIQDIILDISITANRQDIIGVIDIAVELSSLLECPLKLNKSTQLNLIQKTLNNADNLNLFQELHICIIKDIPIQYTDNNINNHFANSDIKITHSILDIINFINFKWGQAIHIYKISNHNNITNYWFNFQLNKNDRLENDLDIYINNKILIPICYKNIHLHKNISDILLINYKYEQINNINKTNKFTSEQYSLYAYQDILDKLNQTPQNTIYKYKHQNRKNKTITCKIETINKVLGPIINNKQTYINKHRIISILQNLNFHIHEKNNTLYLQVPIERTEDIEYEIDIIEEIGRIYGFNHFQDILPKFQYISKTSKITYITQKIRRILRSMGLHEVINYSLQPKTTKPYIPLINPLNQEQNILRKNLIHNLIEAKMNNINQANHIFEGFEIGKIFRKSSTIRKYEESLHLCCILGNKKFNHMTWEHDQLPLNWFQAKGHLEEFFEKMNAKISWSIKGNSNIFTENLQEYIHSKKRIYIKHNNITFGILSELNNQLTKKFNLSYKIYFFEINIYELIKTIKNPSHIQHIYLPYSPYPKITRDFSIKINTKFYMENINLIIKNIQKQQNKVIESITILNEYHNTKTIKTICFRVTYRSQQRTLTNKEIKILDNMLKTQLDINLQSKT